jgi:hypothetical protein
MSDSVHEILDVRSRQPAERLKAQGSVFCHAGGAELASTVAQQRRPTSFAAASHFAIATCCVVPWTSGTVIQLACNRRRTVYRLRGDVDRLVSGASLEDRLDLAQLVGVASDEHCCQREPERGHAPNEGAMLAGSSNDRQRERLTLESNPVYLIFT